MIRIRGVLLFIFVLSLILNISPNNVDAKELYYYTNMNGIMIDESTLSTLYELGFTRNEIETLTESEFAQFQNIKIKTSHKAEVYIKTKIGYDKNGKQVIIEEKLPKDKFYDDYSKSKKKDASIDLISTQSIVIEYPGDSGSTDGSSGTGEISEYPDCEHFDNEVICFKDTEHRRLTLHMAVTNENYMFLKATTHWLKIPTTREEDVFGISIPENTTLKQSS